MRLSLSGCLIWKLKPFKGMSFMSLFSSICSSFSISSRSLLYFSIIFLRRSRLFSHFFFKPLAFRPRIKISWNSSSVYVRGPRWYPFGVGVITGRAVWGRTLLGVTVEPLVYTGLDVECIAHIWTSTPLLACQ